ncbi:MAG: energy-coupling factor transporter transmembrane component T [Bacillota bacterium]
MITFPADSDGSTAVSKLNPITKLIVLVSACTVALRLKEPLHALICFGLILIGHLLTKVRPAILWQRTRGIFMFGIILFASQIALVCDVPWQTRIANGALMSLRFLNVVLASHLFVSVTSSEDFAYALMQAGLPYRYGFALLAAMRFVPYFKTQANTVLQAQMARGMEVDRPTPKGIFLMAKHTFVPVIVTALSKVDSLAISMEGRCFGLYSDRTYRRRIPFHWLDGVVICASIAGIVASFYLI